MIFADREGVIRLWNHGAEVMFGYSAEDAIGQSLDLIIPERHRVRHWDGYRKVMVTGTTRYGKELLAVPAIRKDGRRISLEFSIALLRDETGALGGAAAIIRDVTARWERERTLRQFNGCRTGEGSGGRVGRPAMGHVHVRPAAAGPVCILLA